MPNIHTENTPRRAVLLGRVSRGERQQDPESQLIALRAAAQRLGWRVVQELPLKLSAWDESATAEVRRRALAPIEAGDADTLMVWSWDRLSRGGIEEAFALLQQLEGHLGGAFYSLQEPFLSTATADAQQRELMLSIMSWSAKWESQRKSERLKAKVQSKRQRSELLGKNARWGRGKLATHAQITEARQMHAQGYTVRTIANLLSLSKSQVHRLLTVG